MIEYTLSTLGTINQNIFNRIASTAIRSRFFFILVMKKVGEVLVLEQPQVFQMQF